MPYCDLQAIRHGCKNKFFFEYEDLYFTCFDHHQSVSFFCRFIPSNDLFEIYKEYYGKEMITKDTIEECTTLLFLAWLGEKIAGAKLFKKYAQKSPFLHQRLHNYFLGINLI